VSRISVEHAVEHALTRSADPSGIYATILAAIGESLGWSVAAAWEETPDGRKLRCVEVWQGPDVDAGSFRVLTERLLLDPGDGLPGRVWQTGEPAWIADLDVDDNFPRSAAASAAGLRAAFCFPVAIDEKVVGAIEFLTAGHQEPDENLLASMTLLGRQVGRLVGRRQAEDAVRAGEALNRAILAAALDAVVAVDDAGRVLEFNPAAERIFGYRREEAIGRDMAELIVPPALREQHRRGFARYLATEESVVLDHRIEITGMRSDGTEFPVELTITRISLAGRPTFTGFLRDITERKRIEAELRASRSRLVETADAERRRIERNIHDGAQQRLVAATLQLRLARPGLTPEAREQIAEVERELVLALEELRELARGIHPAVLAERGLGPAVVALCDRLPIPVDVVELPTTRLPDSVELAAYYVVAEALTNATKHAGGARVEVALRQAGGALEIVVADDGVGGASLALGTGLRGLGDRVEAADGRLELHSPAGGGTRLRAEIPLA
jgi:PAS domain S-box-containing protein